MQKQIKATVTENPKLKTKVLSDGNLSLYLDYYLGRVIVYDEALDREVSKVQRKREFLKLTIFSAPRTPEERQRNKDTMELAEKIRFERAQELLQQGKGYSLKKPQKTNYLHFVQSYIDDYTKKDKRMVVTALRRFKEFLGGTPKYSVYRERIEPQQLTREMMMDFAEYLQGRSVGEGAKSIFERFKKVARYAVNEAGLPLPQNLFYHVNIKTDERQITKDFLSPEEEERLIATHYDNENPNIRRAFVFCLYTGLRWCDVKELTYANFDLPNRLLRYEQDKTKGHSSSSRVTVPLCDEAIALVGDGGKNEVVFPLPSHTMCLKALRRWTKRAGIDKHITWHCARHSFGTNMAATAAKEGLSIRVVQELMGHSSLRYTERYTRVVDEQKRAAISSLSRAMNQAKEGGQQ